MASKRDEIIIQLHLITLMTSAKVPLVPVNKVGTGPFVLGRGCTYPITSSEPKLNAMLADGAPRYQVAANHHTLRSSFSRWLPYSLLLKN